jgi:hypothetical protein
MLISVGCHYRLRGGNLQHVSGRLRTGEHGQIPPEVAFGLAVPKTSHRQELQHVPHGR